MNDPLFTSLASATLKRVEETFRERGEQYGDSWGSFPGFCVHAIAGVPRSAHVMALAAMVDVKYSRLQGGYKDDTLIDLIAYAAALAEEMRKGQP